MTCGASRVRLVGWPWDALSRERRRQIVVAALAAYVVLTAAVTHLNFYRDTQPVILGQTDAAARAIVPYNY